jgi:hypothetical protein
MPQLSNIGSCGCCDGVNFCPSSYHYYKINGYTPYFFNTSLSPCNQRGRFSGLIFPYYQVFTDAYRANAKKYLAWNGGGIEGNGCGYQKTTTSRILDGITLIEMLDIDCFFARAVLIIGDTYLYSNPSDITFEVLCTRDNQCGFDKEGIFYPCSDYHSIWKGNKSDGLLTAEGTYSRSSGYSDRPGTLTVEAEAP